MLGLVEVVVYGVICYSSVVGLICAAVSTGVVVGRTQSILRIAFLLPGIICAGLLATAGPEIPVMETNTASYTFVAPNVTIADYDSISAVLEDLEASDAGAPVANVTLYNSLEYSRTTVTQMLPIHSPMWITFHYMLFIALVTYMLTVVLSMFLEFDSWARRGSSNGGKKHA